MGTQSVTLPNGQVVNDVPEGTTQKQLLDSLARGGVITPEDVTAWTTKEEVKEISNSLSKLPGSMTQGPVGARPETYEGMDPLGTLSRNADVPAGIAGSVAGAKMGTPFGPAGVIAGTVAGGAIGTFGGSVLSDYLTGEEVSLSDATKEAAISAGIDTATLGVASKFKSVAKILGLGGEETGSLWQKFMNPPPTTVDTVQNFPVGSTESLKQTQALLEKFGGSLTGFQTGQATAAQRITEGIGKIGILSSPIYKQLDKKNAEAIGTMLQGMMDSSLSDAAGDSMGSVIHGVVRAGVEATSVIYDQAMDKIAAQAGGKFIRATPLANRMKAYLAENTRSFGVDLDEGTVNFLNKWITQLESVKEMPLTEAIAFQKRLNTEVNKLGEFGLTQNTTASRELAILMDKMRGTISDQIRAVDPKAADMFSTANKEFGDATSKILPDLNAGSIKRADKEEYESIARVLEGKNPERIKQFMTSVDAAFEQAAKAKIDVKAATGIATAEEARQAIQAGWLKNIFGAVGEEGFTPETFRHLARKFERPSEIRSAQAILGKDFNQFKALINAMRETTEKQTGFIGSLVLRAKESEAIGGVAQGIAGTGAFTAGGPLAAGAVFLGPVMLAKIAQRPGAIRALLDGNRKANAAMLAGKTSVAGTVMEETMSSIMGMLSEEDQAEVRNSIRQQ